MELPPNGKPSSVDNHGDGELRVQLRRLSRRGFAWGGVAALAGLAGWRWLVTRSQEEGLPWPLRRVLEFDERLARRTLSRIEPLAGIPSLGGADAPRQRFDRARLGPRSGHLEAPGRRGSRRAGASIVHARRYQGPPPGRDDDRAALRRGLERGRPLGRRGWPTWPRPRAWRPAAAGRPSWARTPTTCSATPRSRHPTANTTSGSTWPAPSIPRPCSATRWMAGP